jgi:hypothetical protein
MTIAYSDTAPVHVQINTAEPDTWPKDALKYSGDTLPAIGATVRARGSLEGQALGLARVVAYFTEDGFLGLVCEPLAPPPRFLRNVADYDSRLGANRPYRGCYHLFGPEFAEP